MNDSVLNIIVDQGSTPADALLDFVMLTYASTYLQGPSACTFDTGV